MPRPKHITSPAFRFVTVWLATLIIAGAVLFPLFSLFFLTWSNGALDWINRAYECKSRSLARHPASSGSRLLIFGGSASFFGIDAEMIQDELGIQTVNFATHGGLGLDYQISRIKRAAKNGDSVLLCLELEAYADGSVPTESLREYVFSFDKGYVFALKPRVMLSLLFLNAPGDYAEAITRWNEKLAGKSEENAGTHPVLYSMLKMSQNGDFRGLTLERPLDPYPASASFSPYAKAALESLAQWSREHGIRLLITWPNRVDFPPPDGTNQFKLHAQVAKFCEAQRIPVVGTPEESVYPKELFIDTVYHLNGIGAHIRTEKLIRHLRGAFGRKPLGNPKTICLMASRDTPVNQRGIFDKNESVEYKYLTETQISHPDCITPDDLRTVGGSGVKVVCIDDATELLAGKAGVRFNEIRRHEASLGEWIERYNHHLFFLSLVGTNRCPVAIENLPESFVRFLSGDEYRAGVAGTGPWKKAHRNSRGAEMAEWGKRRFDPLSIPVPFHFRVDLKSGPVTMFSETTPPIVIEGESLAEITPGLAVAVIDPDLGIVVAQGTFQGEALLEWKLRQLEIP